MLIGKLVKLGIEAGIKRAIEIGVPALALFSAFNLAIYLIELAV